MSLPEGLKPQSVLKFFEQLSEIPRGSANEKAAAAFCVKFAKDRGLWVYEDEHFNVLIKKEGTGDTLVLQGHLDMVCEKNADTVHNFETDGIKLIVEGDNLRANGTTLGADNGIAVAIMLAILDDKSLSHPPLECLFTSQEEVGLVGAHKFDYSQMKGKKIINIDSGEYGKILISCAGGATSAISIPIEWADTKFTEKETVEIQVRGLKGGHSGGDIHLGRANANKVLGRALYALQSKIDYELCAISGGDKDNAIPREAQALININKGEACKLDEIIEHIESIIVDEYRGAEEHISIKAEKMNEAKEAVRAYSKEVSAKVVSVMMSLPCGVLSMSRDINGLVESSCNFAVIRSDEKCVKFTISMRSSVESKKRYTGEIIQNIALLAGGSYFEGAQYPGWRYNPNSELRKKAEAVYEAIEGMPPKIEAIHAGLECGIFADKIEGADIISIGPDMWDVHTPEERVSIESIEKVYNLLLEIIKSW